MPASHPQDNPFHGIYAASATPLHPDLSCDYGTLADHYHDLIKKGCQGIVLFGTTGEGSSFSVKERIQALEALIPLGVDPQRCIVGVICSAFQDAVDLIQCALNNHYLAVMVVPPFYFKQVSEGGVEAFYRELIKRVSHPQLRLLLYHIPQFSGVPITLNCVKTLHKEFPNTVIGLKESEGNLAFTRDMLKHHPDFKVFVGNELQIAEAVQAGAAGAIVGLANVFPELIVSLYQQNTARQHEMQTILSVVKKYPIFSAIKSLLETQKGASWHSMRPPLVPLEKEVREALKLILRGIL